MSLGSWVKRVTASVGIGLLLTTQDPSLTTAFSEEASAYSRAVAAYQDRHLEEALSCAKEAVRENPEHVEALLLLGELYYLRQELPKAKETWEKALQLAPSRTDLKERLDRLKREIQVESDLSRSDTHPFVVRFAQEQMPVDVGLLRKLLRDTYRLVGQQLGYFPTHTITVILYPEGDFEQVKGLSHQVAGLYDGKIRLPVTKNLERNSELNRILWHEYTHALVHDLAKGKCPLWLNEGIATLQEARIRLPEVDLVRVALQEKGKALPTWDELWKQNEYDPNSMKLHYQQAYLIAQYLVKRWGGWQKLIGCLKRLGQGYPIADAIRAEYKVDPAALEREWLSWLRRNL